MKEPLSLGRYGRGRYMGKGPVSKVKAVLYRNDPILLGPPFILLSNFTVCEGIRRTANIMRSRGKSRA